MTPTHHKLAVLPARPSLVSWNVTAACNLHCPHCYLDAGLRRGGELDTEEAFEVVDGLARAGTEMLVLTGGEPLLRRDLEAIAARAAGRGMIVVLGTNGVLLDDERARSLAAAGVRGVGLSLDSIDPARHDAFRGLPGAWERTVAAIDASQAAGLEVVLQWSITSWNVGELEAFVAFAQSRGVHTLAAYYLVCTGRAARLADLDADVYQASLAALVEAQRDLGSSLLIRAKCAPHAARIAAEAGLPDAGSSGCIAGRSYLRIGPEGEITPCPYLPDVVGNVRKRPIDEVWGRAPSLLALRERKLEGRCGRCEHAEVCGGCRARALAFHGDIAAEDPWCDYQPPPRSAAEATAVVGWTPEALARLERVPGFLRDRLRLGLEGHARARGATEVTPELMAEVRAAMGPRHMKA